MFTDASDALNWAYNIHARQIVKMSAINNMRQERTGVRYNMLLFDLTEQEAHGQAGQIIGMVDKLSDPAGSAYLRARFGKMVERHDLAIVVYRGCAALGVGLDKREGVYRVVRGYFGGSLSLRAVRKSLGCRHQYAGPAKDCIYDTLDIIHNHSMAEISAILERHKLIEVSRYA